VAPASVMALATATVIVRDRVPARAKAPAMVSEPVKPETPVQVPVTDKEDARVQAHARGMAFVMGSHCHLPHYASVPLPAKESCTAQKALVNVTARAFASEQAGLASVEEKAFALGPQNVQGPAPARARRIAQEFHLCKALLIKSEAEQPVHRRFASRLIDQLPNRHTQPYDLFHDFNPSQDFPH